MQVATEIVHWSWHGKPLTVGLDRSGDGPTVLLLPALSSISSRDEMRPLLERLAARYSVVTVDWPGFGTLAKPKIAWAPDAYRAFLKFVVTEVVRRPYAAVAAGHAAPFLLAQAADDEQSTGRLCLLSPTWRGPLPTMMNRRSRAFAAIGTAADWPLVGPLLYRINVNPFVIRMMARGHVYVDPAWLDTSNRMQAKLKVANVAGARHASVRFVAGELDAVRARKDFLSLAAAVRAPVLVLYGAAMPRKSRQEVEALASLANVRLVQLATGKLSMYEEFPDLVASELAKFLDESPFPGRAAF